MTNYSVKKLDSLRENKKTLLPSNIKYLRQNKGITQKKIADFCNKSDVAISYWENGSREPNTSDLAKLSQLFNVPVDELLLKDLRIQNKENSNEFDELELLFKKNKDILTEDDKETIKFLIEKRIREIDKQNHNE